MDDYGSLLIECENNDEEYLLGSGIYLPVSDSYMKASGLYLESIDQPERLNPEARKGCDSLNSMET